MLEVNQFFALFLTVYKYSTENVISIYTQSPFRDSVNRLKLAATSLEMTFLPLNL